jgi:uncharacterized protein YutE (UPF0331/DUF86 family)
MQGGALHAMLVSGLRLGLPAEEDDLFEKLAERGILARPMADGVRQMKGLRNILVHEYARIDDALVFENVRHRLADLETFRQAVLAFLRTQ